MRESALKYWSRLQIWLEIGLPSSIDEVDIAVARFGSRFPHGDLHVNETNVTCGQGNTDSHTSKTL